MSRLYQLLLIVSTVGLSWLGMQVVHEVGHVIFALMGGERVERVVLHPLVISRTDATHDRHPLLTVWGGPILGVMMPLMALGVARFCRFVWFYLFQFFAGFCLIANGAYLGIGSFQGVGDAGDLLRYGTPRMTLIIFGLVCVPLGLYLWNGLGRFFGLDKARDRVDRRAALATLGTLLIVVLLELVAGNR